VIPAYAYFLNDNYLLLLIFFFFHEAIFILCCPIFHDSHSDKGSEQVLDDTVDLQ
jgi:hypothetical protein